MKMTKTYQKTREKQKNEQEVLPGYPGYSHDEDIYSKAKEEYEIDPENTDMKKSSIYDESDLDDLDIPGSEMDDDQEDLGNEDEENNYYSLPDNDEPDDDTY